MATVLLAFTVFIDAQVGILACGVWRGNGLLSIICLWFLDGAEPPVTLLLTLAAFLWTKDHVRVSPGFSTCVLVRRACECR